MLFFEIIKREVTYCAAFPHFCQTVTEPQYVFYHCQNNKTVTNKNVFYNSLHRNDMITHPVTSINFNVTYKNVS